jgi:hypothetical protein
VQQTSAPQTQCCTAGKNTHTAAASGLPSRCVNTAGACRAVVTSAPPSAWPDREGLLGLAVPLDQLAPHGLVIRGLPTTAQTRRSVTRKQYVT